MPGSIQVKKDQRFPPPGDQSPVSDHSAREQAFPAHGSGLNSCSAESVDSSFFLPLWRKPAFNACGIGAKQARLFSSPNLIASMTTLEKESAMLIVKG
jgi:hypothetical protein